MSRLDVPGRITGLDTARAVAILGMIATHVFPLMQADPSGALTPTWVGASLTGVSSALFVVLAGVGLTLLTKNAVDIWASRVQLSLRAIVLLVIGLLLGLVGSSVAIILVHYGVLFLLTMWFINLSKRALAVTAISWVMLAPFVHGVLTRFMQVQAGGATAYAENWRLRSEEHTSELQSRGHLVCRLLLEKKKKMVAQCQLFCRYKRPSLNNSLLL